MLFIMLANGHLYVVGRSRCNRECQTRRKVGARSDLSDRQDTRLPYYNLLAPGFYNSSSAC